MMKRILCFMLPCILLLALTACNSSDIEQPAKSVISSATPEEKSQASAEEMQDTPEDSPKLSETVEPAVPPAAETQAPVTSNPPKEEPPKEEPPKEEPPKEDDSMVNIQIATGDNSFSAKLYNNQATQAFMKQLPLTITMDELNGNEKFYYLSDSLPTDSYNPAEIKAGDLMLYGSDCLVLFYENFSTAYSYTRLGFIENASGLSDALGSSSVSVTFKAE